MSRTAVAHELAEDFGEAAVDLQPLELRWRDALEKARANALLADLRRVREAARDIGLRRAGQPAGGRARRVRAAGRRALGRVVSKAYDVTTSAVPQEIQP
jgi:hypothetical protein